MWVSSPHLLAVFTPAGGVRQETWLLVRLGAIHLTCLLNIVKVCEGMTVWMLDIHMQVLISDGSVYKLWSTYSWGACLIWAPIDGFQISSKCPTSGGQTHDQEAAVQWTFQLERESIFYLSVLMVRTWCSAYYILYFVHSCTKHRPQLLPSGSEATSHENHL